MIEKILEQFKKLENVDAIALGGSRAGTNYDEKSDYDIYVYINSPISVDIRNDIYKNYAKIIEVKNQYWEEEDNIVLNDDIPADIIYRNLNDFINDVKSVAVDCIPHNSYTTCMWHNLINSKIIYDKNGNLEQAKKELSIPYPDQLSKNIVERNHNLLNLALPNYYDQIKKATKRGDLVSINHRTAEFLASYFDLIFALNKKTHPGEKRLVKLAIANCEKLPAHFEENLNELFKAMFSDSATLLKVLDQIIFELEKIL